MLRYKINKISEIDISQLSDFYKKIYHKRHKSLTNNWRWWYRVGHSEFEPIVLSIDNKIIGQAGLIPIDLNIKGKKTQAIWFVDFAILPEFRGKGFGQILTKEWMKICPNQITFCNNQSLKIFNKFGWKHNLFTKRLVKPISPLKFLPILKSFNLNFVNIILKHFMKKKLSRDISIEPFAINNNFKVINDSFKLKQNITNDNLAEIVRDEKWLYWRLIESPYSKDIHFFEYKNNFAVVRIFSHKNINRLNILYTYHTDNLQDYELLVLILNWAIKNNIDVIWAIKNRSKSSGIFSNLLSKSLNFAAWSSDEKILDVLKNGLTDIQGIDSDIDSILYVD